MITRNVLYVRRAGGTYGYHLHTNNISGNPPIMVRKNGSNLYCPTYSGTSVLNIRKNGNNYYASDQTPVLYTHWDYWYDFVPYQRDYIARFQMWLANGVSINNYCYLYNWGSLYLTIPPGGTSADTGWIGLGSGQGGGGGGANFGFQAFVGGTEIRNAWWPYSGQTLDTGIPEYLWGV